MTARFSPIAPITLLEKMYELEASPGSPSPILGDYLLLLAHEVLNTPYRYEELITKVRALWGTPEDAFIIMDNSVVELGAAMDIDDVIEAASVVEADCIMCPDVLGEMASTKQLIAEQAGRLLTCNFPLMRVPQGKHHEELVQCVDWIHSYLPAGEGNPEYWGIPRCITNESGSRGPIVQYINTITDKARIHLLGMSYNYFDDCASAMLPNVMGIDSANPLVLGYANCNMKHTKWSHPDRGNYWKYTYLNQLVLTNIEAVRRAIVC